MTTKTKKKSSRVTTRDFKKLAGVSKTVATSRAETATLRAKLGLDIDMATAIAETQEWIKRDTAATELSSARALEIIERELQAQTIAVITDAVQNSQDHSAFKKQRLTEKVHKLALFGAAFKKLRGDYLRHNLSYSEAVQAYEEARETYRQFSNKTRPPEVLVAYNRAKAALDKAKGVSYE